MTRAELQILLKISRNEINKSFWKEQETNAILRDKNSQKGGWLSIDYTFEECVSFLRWIPTWNPMMKAYLKEHFVHRTTKFNTDKVIKIRQTKEQKSLYSFLFFFNHNHHRACALCHHLYARSYNNANGNLHPYCEWYQVFLDRKQYKRDIYKEYCPTFTRTQQPPLIWISEKVYPLNRLKIEDHIVTILPEEPTMAGVPNDRFKSKRKKNEPITILRDMYSED